MQVTPCWEIKVWGQLNSADFELSEGGCGQPPMFQHAMVGIPPTCAVSSKIGVFFDRQRHLLAVFNQVFEEVATPPDFLAVPISKRIVYFSFLADLPNFSWPLKKQAPVLSRFLKLNRLNIPIFVILHQRAVAPVTYGNCLVRGRTLELRSTCRVVNSFFLRVKDCTPPIGFLVTPTCLITMFG